VNNPTSIKSENVDFKITIYGVPATAAIALFATPFILSIYVYKIFFIYVIALLPVAYLIRIQTKKHYPTNIAVNLGGPWPTTVAIKGLPNSFKNDLEKLISENKLVIFGLPNRSKYNYLKTVLSEYIYIRSGFCEFTHSETFSVSYRPLGKQALLLSYHSKHSLQEAISIMLQRGWQIEGSQSTESNLISRVYTQTMLYNPAAPTTE
jgi:hypothetical protein